MDTHNMVCIKQCLSCLPKPQITRVKLRPFFLFFIILKRGQSSFSLYFGCHDNANRFAPHKCLFNKFYTLFV